MNADYMTLLVAVVGVGFLVTWIWHIRQDLEKLRKSVDTIRKTQLRRSVEYMLIENELSTLMTCLVDGNDDEQLKSKMIKAIQDRHSRLRSRIEYGTGSSEHLRGLEIPLEDEDEWFDSKVAELIVPEAFSSGRE